MRLVMDSWYSLLNGNVTYDSAEVPVYKEDAPYTTSGHYILLRAEGQTWAANKTVFADNVVVIVDVVTVFKHNINRYVVDSIDEQIFNLVFQTPSIHLLDQPAGKTIDGVVRETSTYIEENDGVNSIYRKVSRYNQRVYS